MSNPNKPRGFSLGKSRKVKKFAIYFDFPRAFCRLLVSPVTRQNTHNMNRSAAITRIIPHEVTISVTGAELAELFWALDADEQAEFFNQLGQITSLPLQLSYVTKSESLTLRGRQVMRTLAEYAEP